MGASASGIRAGKAYVELTADDRRLVAGLRSAQRRLQAFGSAVRQLGMQMVALGVGIVAPLALATKAFADAGSQLADLSARTGASVEALSELGYAAGQTGTGLEDIEKAMRVLQKTITLASDGSDAAAEALARVGLSAASLQGLKPEAQFAAVATALRGIADPGERATAAMMLLGKSGTALLPMIQDLEALRGEARRLGVVMSTAQAKAADSLGDAFDRVMTSARAVANALGEALAPTLEALANEVVGFLTGLRQWISDNQGLVVALLTVGAAVAGTGATLIALGLTVGTIAAALSGLATVAAVAGSALSVLGTVVAALFTPIGALIAGTIVGATALGAVIVTQTQTGQQALGLLGQGFQTLADDAVDAWGGIADALASGNIGLAAQIVWATLKLEWERGTAFLLNLWDAAITGFATLFAGAWYGIQDIFWSVVYALADAWDWVVGGITKLWNETVGFIASKLGWLLEKLGILDEGVSLAVEQETGSRNAAVDQERQRRSGARQQALAGLDSERQAVLAGIDQQLVEKVTDRDRGVDAARAELDAALAEAKQARSAAKARSNGPIAGAEPIPVEMPDLEALRGNLDQIPATVAAESQQLDVSGSFSAAAIGQLGLGDTSTERTAKATEETAKNTQRIARALEDGDGLAFG